MSNTTFTLTNVDDESTRQRFAQLRDRVESSLRESVCVVGLPLRRTLKLLTAMAEGAWVVGTDYLQSVARARGTALVDPAPFEIAESLLPGCRRARAQGGGCALLGLEVVLRDATAIPREQLAGLLHAAGATVREGRAIAGGPPLEVICSSDRSKVDDADEAWLLDRIMACDRLDVEASGNAAAAAPEEAPPTVTEPTESKPAEPKPTEPKPTERKPKKPTGPMPTKPTRPRGGRTSDAADSRRETLEFGRHAGRAAPAVSPVPLLSEQSECDGAGEPPARRSKRQHDSLEAPPAAEVAASQLAAAAPAIAGEPGVLYEVAGCDATCEEGCTECGWEECTIVATRREFCDVRIVSDGELCCGVPRRHVRQIQQRLAPGARMEVQGCDECCSFPCNECEWEECTVVADDGATVDVRITEDGELCQGVQRRHLRVPPSCCGSPGAKRARRSSGAAEPAGATSAPAVLLAPPEGATDRLPTGVRFELLAPPAVAFANEFSPEEAQAIRLFRQRLPGCNVDLPDPGSPYHPGARQRSTDGDSRTDFLHLLVHGVGALTAVARRDGPNGPEVFGACTLIPHAAAGLCELQLLAVSRRFSGRGIGSMLVGAVERHLAQMGIRVVVALASPDTETAAWWRRRAYVETTTAKLAPEHRALLRDPFGKSLKMVKHL